MKEKKKPKGLTVDEMEKIKNLLALGRSWNSVAAELGRDPKTVKKYSEQHSGEIEEEKQELADFFESLAKRMITSISDEDIHNINAYQRTIASAAATDKMRLLRGQATSIVDSFRIAIQRIEVRLANENKDSTNKAIDIPVLPNNQ